SGLYLRPYEWIDLPRGPVTIGIGRLNLLFSPLTATGERPSGLVNVIPIVRHDGTGALPPGVCCPKTISSSSNSTSGQSFN
ncbi:hypothetical protein ABTF54_20145, partial [Acinetobacter baumannii]